ncbi:GNAT family N-acetyltransferase [Actinophytocola sp.]|uniref:GNAT family N-acetyltransferase n=1 Tax=Actinophytocola sp. TaxID=1872138 RepID=UPI002D33B163|nr:GNAT family N-acetyltransferase [Actinophytocola sp.]HYQ62605.1 GNAT family N-acetyltransferase [Actinophytocola sp.]
MTTTWSLRSATPRDAEWMADLKATVMRADLERLGYWDHDWARQRFLDTYVPANTNVILVDGDVAGCIAVRAEPDALWIEHFYLRPEFQGHGLGGHVLRHVMTLRQDGRPFKLAVNRGSGARGLYERHGFVYQYDDTNGVDQIFSTPPEDDPDA